MKNKIIKAFVIGLPVLGSLLLSACNTDDKSIDRKPTYNHHLHYTMTVQGHIDPALLPYINRLTVTSVYQSNTKACQVTINPWEGVRRPPLKKYIDVVVPDHQGNFKKKIFIDRITPSGFCRWGIGWISLLVPHYGGTDIALFTLNGDKLANSQADLSINCISQEGSIKCKGSKLTAFSQKMDIAPNKSYVFNLLVNKGGALR